MGYDSRPDTYEHIGQVRGLMLGAAKNVLDRAHVHDQSKLEDPERAMFDEFTPKLRDTTYGSDEYKGYLEQMGVALRHHYDANSHHPEHYEDGVLDMSLFDVIEMLCDWIAATRRHADGDILRSIDQNQERFGYGDDFKRLLLNTLPLLLDGEA